MLINLIKLKVKQYLKKKKGKHFLFQNLVLLETFNIYKLLRQINWIVERTMTLDSVPRKTIVWSL